MTVDPLVSLLIGALGAALLGLFGAWIQSRREHSRWIRENRMVAYREFLGQAEQLQTAEDRPMTERDEDQLVALYSALATVRLLGPDDVYAAAVSFLTAGVEAIDAGTKKKPIEKVNELAKVWDDKRSEFITAARRELGITDPRPRRS
jgi:hypothetical protein